MALGNDNLTPAQRLVTLRIVWGAMLLGQLIFLAVIIFGIFPTRQTGMSGELVRMLFLVAVAMLATAVPIGLVVRRLVYGARRDDGSIEPARYSLGNIIFAALCESASFFGLVVMMLAREYWPYVIVPAVAMAVQAMAYPTGAPMQPDESIPQPLHRR